MIQLLHRNVMNINNNKPIGRIKYAQIEFRQRVMAVSELMENQAFVVPFKGVMVK